MPTANQLFNEYDAESFRQTASYLGMTYSEQLLIVEINSLEARDDQLKKSLLVEIHHSLAAPGVVAADDQFVMITEIGRANVSFGGGAPPGAGLRRSAEVTEENVKQIAVKRPTAECTHTRFPVLEPQKGHSRPGTKPGRRRHQSRRPLERSHPSPRRCPASRALWRHQDHAGRGLLATRSPETGRRSSDRRDGRFGSQKRQRIANSQQQPRPSLVGQSAVQLSAAASTTIRKSR
jgi:hypothetical protein